VNLPCLADLVRRSVRNCWGQLRASVKGEAPATRREPFPGGLLRPSMASDSRGNLAFPRLVAISSLFLTLLNQASAQTDERPIVLVALAPLYSLAKPLVEGTDIELTRVPQEPRSMSAQSTLFTRQADRFAEQFAAADAVITMGKLWAGDPLYTAVREVNIRVVDIDASKPWSHELDGVAVANSPVSKMVSPYFWLSPSNVIRVLDIVGHDLERLYPDHAAAIAANLEKQQADYLQLKNDFERRFVEVADPVVYALTDQFVYLTSDLGIFVDDYFVKQDIDWTADDYTQLTSSLKDSGITVVLHQWEPSAEISQAITAAGARLLVLDTMETTKDFRAGLAANLDALLTAFE
jgi:ABC-type Zn uptake system ZnuABC Zn-binding protein ZnuA